MVCEFRFIIKKFFSSFGQVWNHNDLNTIGTFNESVIFLHNIIFVVQADACVSQIILRNALAGVLSIASEFFAFESAKVFESIMSWKV